MAINEYTESFYYLRQLDIKIYVLNYDYKVLDEISGIVESANISIDADSDIRRTMNISMALNQGLSHDLGGYNYYNNSKQYHKGDIVKFGNVLYECISTHSIDVEVVDSNVEFLLSDSGEVLTITSGDGTYIAGIPPYYSTFWKEYTSPTFAKSMKYWQAGNPYWFDKYIKASVGIKNASYYQYDSVASYDNSAIYYIGDRVKYGGKLYECRTVSTVPISLYVQGTTTGETLTLSTSDNEEIQVQSTRALYIQGIVPTNINYWGELEEYTWINEGMYIINAPSITYNSTDNTLSFQAIDLMSKLTGMRNGYLEGMEYQILAGSTINTVMKSILEEQGFTQMILTEQTGSETTTTPIDINIDIGSTTYDLLTQLRDINPNWEMFFDINGIFRFQPIPMTDDPVEFGDEVWEKIATGYSLETSFEDVKNYCEVIGKQVEPDETATATQSSTTVTVTLKRTWASYVSSSTEIPVVWYIGFTLGDVSATPSLLSSPIREIIVNDSAGSVSQTITIGTDNEPIWYNNETYFLRLTFTNEGYSAGAFGGYLQLRAVAFENNPESPFYVGYSIKHYSSVNNLLVNFVDADYSEYITEYTIVGASGNADLDITTGLSYTDFDAALEGTQWKFRVDAITNGTPISTINLSYGGGTYEDYYVTNGTSVEGFEVSDITGGTTYSQYDVQTVAIQRLVNSPIYNDNTSFTSSNTISLDYDNSYIFTMQKVGTGSTATLKIIGTYYPIPAELWDSPTTKIHDIPRFTNMVRGVFSGDEYDNIYTNDLALQRAKYELYLNCRLHDTINIDCVPLYWLDVNRLMAYTANNQAESNKWIIKSVTTDLSVSGTQSVNAMRYYPLYDTN